MPGGNRTGPLGQGPMTGRGMGNCAGYPRQGMAMGRGLGRGLGAGFGRGAGGRAGWGATPVATPLPQTDAETLRQQVNRMEESLSVLKDRLAAQDAE